MRPSRPGPIIAQGVPSRYHREAHIKVDNLNMIDGGNGEVLAAYVSSYPAMLRSIFAAVADTTGIDIRKAISRNDVAVAELPQPVSEGPKKA